MLRVHKLLSQLQQMEAYLEIALDFHNNVYEKNDTTPAEKYFTLDDELRDPDRHFDPTVRASDLIGGPTLGTKLKRQRQLFADRTHLALGLFRLSLASLKDELELSYISYKRYMDYLFSLMSPTAPPSSASTTEGEELESKQKRSGEINTAASKKKGKDKEKPVASTEPIRDIRDITEDRLYLADGSISPIWLTQEEQAVMEKYRQQKPKPVPKGIIDERKGSKTRRRKWRRKLKALGHK